MKKKMKKAFTLVELLVVIAILAVLSTVAIVGYNSFTEKAQKSADQQAVTQMNTVVEAAGVLENIETGSDAYEAIIENGYDGEFKTAYGAYSMAWLAEEKAVVLVTQEAVAFPEEYAGISLDKVSPLYTVEPSTAKELNDALAGKGSNWVNIELTQDIASTEKIVVEKGVTAVMNLKDADVTSTDKGVALENYGDLTINLDENSAIYSSNTQKSQGKHAIENKAGANLTVNGGSIGTENLEGAGASLRNNGGTVELNNVNLVNNSYWKKVDGVEYYAYTVINSLGTIVLNDCHYEGSTHGIFYNNGKIEINGGEYIAGENTSGYIFAGSGYFEVNSGKFVSEALTKFRKAIYYDFDNTGNLFSKLDGHVYLRDAAGVETEIFYDEATNSFPAVL